VRQQAAVKESFGGRSDPDARQLIKLEKAAAIDIRPRALANITS
jgi:hypothetical protein